VEDLRAHHRHLRRIRFKDPDSGKTLVFLTNNTTLPPLTIAALYKSRWQVFDQLHDRSTTPQRKFHLQLFWSLAADNLPKRLGVAPAVVAPAK
jgi:hypothetical protein